LITEKGMSDLRKLVGVPVQDSLEPWCYEATRDNIRHWAHGIGDDNPLWCDPAYAGNTSYGRLVAPPSFIFPLNRSFSGYVAGLPGIHAMFAGIDVTWHHPILLGDEFTTKVWLKELVEHQTRFAGRSIQQIYRCEFYNQNRQLVAEGDSWCFRTERDTAREQGTKYEAVKKKAAVHYTRDELGKIFALYAAEQIRGAEPRYVEDVHVGDQLPKMVKGPMTVPGFIAFAQGWGGLYIRANKLAWKQLQKHPGLGIANRFGIPDVPERVHWDDDLAALVGTPAAYDYGPERCSWMAHHLTNWMGSDGFLRHLRVVDCPPQLRRRYALHRWGSIAVVCGERRALRRAQAEGAESGRRTIGAGRRHRPATVPHGMSFEVGRAAVREPGASGSELR